MESPDQVPWCFELTMFAFVLVSRLGYSRHMRAAVELERCQSRTESMENAVVFFTCYIQRLYGYYLVRRNTDLVQVHRDLKIGLLGT